MSRTSRTAAIRPTVDLRQSTRLTNRRQAFLDAADALFRERGFAAATLDEIIARSGGSRQTLYAMFGGKEGLFRAIVTERSASIYGSGTGSDCLIGEPALVLRDVGKGYLRLMFSPAAIGHYRMVMSEGVRFPEIAQAYWAAGPAHNLERLSTYFAAQVREGALALPDTLAASHHFWGMLQGRIFVEVALALRPAPSEREIAAIVDAAVTQFLNGCRSSKGPAARSK